MTSLSSRFWESRAHRLPQQDSKLMPTRTGNILRSAETRPADKYGLDVLSCGRGCGWSFLSTRGGSLNARAILWTAL